MSDTSLLSFACVIAGLLLVSCSQTDSDTTSHGDDLAAHWGYDADNGPDKWGSMNPDWATCDEGSEQSPIDLANAIDTELAPIEIDRPTDQEVQLKNQSGVIHELDNGHTIQINAKTGETMSVEGKSYALVQFHFHAPSEHTVNGEHFAMEMHFVHQATDGSLAVLGALIKEGAENPGIAPLWAHLPKGPGAETTVQIPALFAQQVLPDVGSGFYHYAGSLTTPPCSERVNWYIRLTPTEFSEDQIAAFTAAYDHNNRPVQALNERTLYKDASPSVTVR